MMNDLVSRQDAIDAIMNLQPYNTKRELINRIEASVADAEGYLGGIAMALDEIEDLPSAQPERKTGHWKEQEITDDKCINEWQSAKCSVCGKWHTTPYLYSFKHYEFCPNCGAKMEVGE